MDRRVDFAGTARNIVPLVRQILQYCLRFLRAMVLPWPEPRRKSPELLEIEAQIRLAKAKKELRRLRARRRADLDPGRRKRWPRRPG